LEIIIAVTFTHSKRLSVYLVSSVRHQEDGRDRLFRISTQACVFFSNNYIYFHVLFISIILTHVSSCLFNLRNLRTMSTVQNALLPTCRIILTKEELCLVAPSLEVMYSALDNIIWCRDLYEWTCLYDMMYHGLLALQAVRSDVLGGLESSRKMPK